MIKTTKIIKKISTRIKVINWEKIIPILLLIVALGGLIGSLYFYNEYKKLKVNPSIQADEKSRELVSALGKLMELPKNEVPTVATIFDKDKLKDQPFFNQAQNGDVLFAYTTSMKAILYRPSTGKIINVAPISVGSNESI